VWELIDGHRTVDEIVDVIVAEFEVSRPAAAADLDAFFRQLIDKGLVTTA
jgi:hypothetical protein